MKKVKFFSSVAVALALLLSVLLFAESAALANSAALTDPEPSNVVCFRNVDEDTNPNYKFAVSVFKCEDCKKIYILSASDKSSCIPKAEGTIK